LGGGLELTAGGQIINSTISGNTSAQIGGAIIAIGSTNRPLRIMGSTVSNNRSIDISGGIYFVSSGLDSALELINSTVSDNLSAADANGLLVRAEGPGTAVALLRNTIVANNLARNFATEVSGGGTATISSLGFNLSDNYNGAMTLLSSDLTGDPRLGPLAPQGGTVPVQLLLGGSPALDRGSSAGSVADQRGLPTPFDIGENNNGHPLCRKSPTKTDAVFLLTWDLARAMMGAMTYPRSILVPPGSPGTFHCVSLRAPGLSLRRGSVDGSVFRASAPVGGGSDTRTGWHLRRVDLGLRGNEQSLACGADLAGGGGKLVC